MRSLIPTFLNFRIARGVVALSLFTLFAGTLSAANIVTVRADAGDGPHAVLVVPASPHDKSIGIAKQIETVPLARGRLTIVETDGEPDAAKLAGVLASASASGENQPDWLWVHHGAVSDNESSNPVIRIAIADDGALAKIMEGALETESTVTTELPDGLGELAGRGVVTVEYAKGARLSRQVRYTRQWTVALLREAGMIAAQTDFRWEALTAQADHLIALYDAEGIGGAGPKNLERIADDRIDSAGIYRVCGEDIREGALGPAATSIFPGGSGRGIGNGLDEEGREMLRKYIASGGGYVGVCAGAYFAGSGLDDYLHAIDLRHSQPWRRGRDMVEIELTSEGKALFGDEKTVLETRYNNGPVFLPVDQEDGGDSNFVTLATFKTPSTDSKGVVREEMVGQAAVGSLTYGDGRVLIISPHPESHTEHYDFVARAIRWTMAFDRNPQARVPELRQVN